MPGSAIRSNEAPTFALPPAVEMLWGVRERSSRGPRRGLSLERIVAAAIDVAQAEGIGGLSMGRVAAELGAATMSLYRYVSAKDELLMLMVDTAMGPPPGPRLSDDGWRAGLSRWAQGARASYQRHPWSLRVPITTPPLGPNMVAWMDDGLRCLAGTPLSEQEKLSSVLLLSGFVRNEATLSLDLRTAASDGHIMPGYGAMLGRLINPATFPSLQRAIDSGSLDDDDDMDSEFDFGLARLLDGIAVLAERPDVPPG
ncbi:TetR/AcrR family transcriptional regulator [Frankia canadensis]|uniref:TetR/AcrR family transcriptional regulator n=1 Tax=Frankia canadensis TaxID=1836972 RepID=UPI001FAFA119|nr:TetR/AcrR family transcriptional regulator [Frankia canadensis]